MNHIPLPEGWHWQGTQLVLKFERNNKFDFAVLASPADQDDHELLCKFISDCYERGMALGHRAGKE